jgi:uncharacterized FAD-dependent dehydrogenase
MHTHTATWIDLDNKNFQYVVDIDQHRFFSDDGVEWTDKHGKLAMTIGFKNSSIFLIGGPAAGETVR